MSIAEKLTTIAENQQKVYEAGQKSEYDRFWDKFQNKGLPTIYYYAFPYNRYSDETYTPKYDLVGSSANTAMQNVFYSNSLTDTKVAMIVNSNNLGGAFYYCEDLVTIRKIVLNQDITAGKSVFARCFALENITIEGEGRIAYDWNIKDSPLTKASIDNIFEYLKDFTEWTLNNSVSNVEQDRTTGEFPYDKVKFVLNENIENPQNYFLVYEESASMQQSPELTTSFNENGELIISNFFMTNDNDGRTEFKRVEDGNGNILVKGTDYNIYTGTLPSTSKTITFNATAVDNAYTSDEWYFKVRKANKKGWTVETV